VERAPKLGSLHWLDPANGRRRHPRPMGSPADPASHPLTTLNTIARGPHAAEDRFDRPRRTPGDPPRPLTRSLRLSGESGALWRDAGSFAPSPVTHRAHVRARALSSVLSAVSPPRRALSPPWPARNRNPDRFPQSGTNHPHLCTRGCAALRAGSATIAELNLAGVAGDVASDDADVWK
jgi:hypothetical protein